MDNIDVYYSGGTYGWLPKPKGSMCINYFDDTYARPKKRRAKRNTFEELLNLTIEEVRRKAKRD